MSGENIDNIAGLGVSWEEFGRTVKEYREKRGLTQAQLGDQVGCTGSAIGVYEAGDIDNAFYKYIKGIQLALGIPDNLMPGAVGELTVDWVQGSYRYEVRMGDKTYIVVSQKSVEDNKALPPVRSRVYFEAVEIPEASPVFWMVLKAVQKYHRERWDKKKQADGDESSLTDQG